MTDAELRELDAEVHREVFGKECEPLEVATVRGLEDRYVQFTGHGIVRTPRYSTDIAAAWQVVEKLNLRGMWYTIDGGRLGLPVRVQFSFGEEVEAPTAPLSICRAALAAVRSHSSTSLSPEPMMPHDNRET